MLEPGDLDPSLDGTGLKRFVTFIEPMELAVQPDGKIIVAGFRPVSNSTRARLIRILPDGTVDTSFSSDGVVEDSGAYFYSSVAVDAEGLIYVGKGDYLLRYLPDWQPRHELR